MSGNAIVIADEWLSHSHRFRPQARPRPFVVRSVVTLSPYGCAQNYREAEWSPAQSGVLDSPASVPGTVTGQLRR